MSRAKLEAELVEIEARGAARSAKEKDLYAEKRRDDARWLAIGAELWRLHLTPIVGVADGVMIRYRNYDQRIPDGAVGTLVKLARKYAEIDLGGHGRWTLPFEHVIAAARIAERGVRHGGIFMNTPAPQPSDPESPQ